MDDVNFCDLVLDQACDDDKCIGYEQIHKEMEIAKQDIASATRKYLKLLRLQKRIKNE